MKSHGRKEKQGSVDACYCWYVKDTEVRELRGCEAVGWLAAHERNNIFSKNICFHIGRLEVKMNSHQCSSSTNKSWFVYTNGQARVQKINKLPSNLRLKKKKRMCVSIEKNRTIDLRVCLWLVVDWKRWFHTAATSCAHVTLDWSELPTEPGAQWESLQALITQLQNLVLCSLNAPVSLPLCLLFVVYLNLHDSSVSSTSV